MTVNEPKDDIETAVTAFFVRSLKPLARILLRYGISYRQMSELCKKVYVEVATRDFGSEEAPASVSRVALLTGMTRRDVRRYRPERDETEEQAVARTNFAARVLSGWFQDSDFHDDAGHPLPLPESGESPSFHELAKRYAPDIPAGTTLAALIDSGAVQRDEHGMGVLVAASRSYLPGKLNPLTNQAIRRSGSVLEDLSRTVDYNLHREADDPSRFERRASNFRMQPEAVADFREFIEAEGQAFLERVDAWLSKREVNRNGPGDSGELRLGLGMYWIEDQPGMDES